MSSSERFEYEWDKYASTFMNKNYEKQFRNWIYPLSEKDFKDKVVLDAGCGMGRNSYLSLKWGAREVISFDLTKRSINRARVNLSKFKNANFFLKSIYDIDWEEKFDLAFSVGVIHHLKDPKLALKNVVRSLKKGGIICIWAYSYEGNEWIVRYVDPIRKNITSKVPLSVANFLSFFCSVPLWVFVKCFKGPTGYLKQISSFDFWHIHLIVLDQLIPDIVNYWSKKDVEDLFGNLEIENISIDMSPNGNGWIILGNKK